jgi:arylsulfatase
MFTHLRDSHRYLAAKATSEDDLYGSGMIEHDMQVGALLDDMKKMGVLDNTIIVYTTDNGPEHSAKNHGGTTPFRGEKMTTYEGGVRVPTMVRWPGHIPAGQVKQGIQANMDLFTTLAAAAGDSNVVEEMKTNRKQIIDGVNNIDYWTGKSKKVNVITSCIIMNRLYVQFVLINGKFTLKPVKIITTSIKSKVSNYVQPSSRSI